MYLCLAHTHGQPASPTRLGKEILVFVERLENQLELLKQVPTFCQSLVVLPVTLMRIMAYPELTGKRFGNQLCE
jgi:adenylosuccinate lyase